MSKEVDFIERSLSLLPGVFVRYEVLRVVQDNSSFGDAAVDFRVHGAVVRIRRERGQLLAAIGRDPRRLSPLTELVPTASRELLTDSDAALRTLMLQVEEALSKLPR